MSNLCLEHRSSDPQSSVLSILPHCFCVLHILMGPLYILTSHTLRQTDSNNLRKPTSLTFSTLSQLPFALLFITVGCPPFGFSPIGACGKGGPGKASRLAIFSKVYCFTIASNHQFRLKKLPPENQTLSLQSLSKLPEF